ncbi:MAG: hypothetical protein WKG03_12180, partial [Telluria sp.]
MMDLKTAARTATCLTLIVALAACAKKEESASVAPAPVQESIAVMAPAAPDAKSAPPAADNAVTAASPAQQMGSSAATFEDGERK